MSNIHNNPGLKVAGYLRDEENKMLEEGMSSGNTEIERHTERARDRKANLLFATLGRTTRAYIGCILEFIFLSIWSTKNMKNMIVKTQEVNLKHIRYIM